MKSLSTIFLGIAIFALLSIPTSARPSIEILEILREAKEVPNRPPFKPRYEKQQRSDERPLTIKILPADISEAKATEERNANEYKVDLERRQTQATEDTAYYTWILVFIAGTQAILFVWQLSYMRRGLKSSEVAANAALVTAQNYVKTERPLLKIQKIETTILPSGAHVSYSFENIGRSPAIIEERVAVLIWTDKLPDVPEYGKPIADRGRVVQAREELPHKEAKGQLTAVYSHGPEIVWGDRLRQSPLIFFGYFTYTDMFDVTRKTGFGYSIDANFGGMIRVGGTAYNYDREE